MLIISITISVNIVLSYTTPDDEAVETKRYGLP